MSIENFLDVLSQQILVGMSLAGRLGVARCTPRFPPAQIAQMKNVSDDVLLGQDPSPAHFTAYAYRLNAKHR